MDATDELLPPFKELFNQTNDIVHPLRAATSLAFDITAPINPMFGILSSFELPSNDKVEKSQRTARMGLERSVEGGVYVARTIADDVGASKLLVVSKTSSKGMSSSTAELKRVAPGYALAARAALNVPMSLMTEAGLSIDVQRKDYSATLKASTSGTLYGAYHQVIGAFPSLGGTRLTAGTEVLVSDLWRSPITSFPNVFPLMQKGPSSSPGLTYAAAVSATSESGKHSAVASVCQIRMGLPKVEAMYTLKASAYTSAVAAFEYNSLTTESKTSLGYRTRFPRTRSTVTASLTSDGGVRGSFERSLLSNVKAALAIDALVVPELSGKPQEIAASLRVSIGPQPKTPLELTPILLRDAPRVWQK